MLSCLTQQRWACACFVLCLVLVRWVLIALWTPLRVAMQVAVAASEATSTWADVESKVQEGVDGYLVPMLDRSEDAVSSAAVLVDGLLASVRAKAAQSIGVEAGAGAGDESSAPATPPTTPTRAREGTSAFVKSMVTQLVDKSRKERLAFTTRLRESQAVLAKDVRGHTGGSMRGCVDIDVRVFFVCHALRHAMHCVMSCIASCHALRHVMHCVMSCLWCCLPLTPRMRALQVEALTQAQLSDEEAQSGIERLFKLALEMQDATSLEHVRMVTPAHPIHITYPTKKLAAANTADVRRRTNADFTSIRLNPTVRIVEGEKTCLPRL